MSTHPVKFLPLYLAVLFCFCSRPALCAQEQVNDMQSQARDYRAQGYQLQKEGELEAALSYYQKSIFLDPQYVLPYNDAGIVYETVGEPELAREMYLKAIEIAPDYPESYSNLALLSEGQEDYVTAVQNWMKRAVLGGKDDPWAETARRRLEQIARLYPEAYSQVGKEYQQSVQEFGSQYGRGSAGPAVKTQETQELPQLNWGADQAARASVRRRDVTWGPQSSKQLKKKAAQYDDLPKIGWLTDDASGIVSTQPAAVDAVEDNKVRALNFLASAREYFSRGQFVAALKEATVAEYLDSSNKEISAFIEKVRKTLLQ